MASQMSMKQKQGCVCILEAKTRKRFLVSKRLGFSQRRFLIYFFFFSQEFFTWRMMKKSKWNGLERRGKKGWLKNDGRGRKLVLWNVYGKDGRVVVWKFCFSLRCKWNFFSPVNEIPLSLSNVRNSTLYIYICVWHWIKFCCLARKILSSNYSANETNSRKKVYIHVGWRMMIEGEN